MMRNQFGILRVVLKWMLFLSVMLQAADSKAVLLTANIMKSHVLAFVPIAEELLERNHTVALAIPNTPSMRLWFPETPVVGLKLIYGIAQTTKAETVFWGPNSQLMGPLFDLADDLPRILEEDGPFDVVVTSIFMFGVSDTLRRHRSVPWMALGHVPLMPNYASNDKEYKCRTPNDFWGITVIDLKSSFEVRVGNQIFCWLVDAWVRYVSLPPLQKKLPHLNSYVDGYTQAPLTVFFGGPPLMLPHRLDELLRKNSRHASMLDTVGIVQTKRPASLTGELRQWLEYGGENNNDRSTARRILYISMGTSRHEMSPVVLSKLIDSLWILIQDHGYRILWSLDLELQRKYRLEELLYDDENRDSLLNKIRLETFTPQAEVLRQPNVKAFLSHCGWGGLQDALFAGVPILAYPLYGDQWHNAARLVDAGVAIKVDSRFSNLVAAVLGLASNHTKRAIEVGSSLKALGGLDRLVDLIELVADGKLPQSPPQYVMEAWEGAIDPYFEQYDQITERYCGHFILTMSLFMAITVPAFYTCCCCYICCFRKNLSHQLRSTLASKKDD